GTDRGGAHRRAQRRTVDGLFLLRSVPARPLARHLHDPRPHRAGKAAGTALRLSRLLDRGLEEDGLQGPLPAAAAARTLRVAACRSFRRLGIGAAGLVLLYIASGDTTRADRAEAILAEGGAISVQVLNELANVSRRKMRRSWTETHAPLNTL